MVQQRQSVCMQVRWKLTRGSWRPKLLNYAQEQDEQAVVKASRTALAEAGAHSLLT